MLLARRERGHALVHRLQLGQRLGRVLVARHGPSDRLEQEFAADRLGQEIFGAGLDRAHAHGDVGAAAQEHDRQPMADADQVILQLQAGQAGHVDVEQDHAGAGHGGAAWKLAAEACAATA
ncbi:hypothetical protein LP420_35725 [Massilia sp. B-10]|nr:hypothetical protein LP420_35725 [Massilia sp. B-10]